jgi:hypothetical protein
LIWESVVKKQSFTPVKKWCLHLLWVLQLYTLDGKITYGDNNE